MSPHLKMRAHFCRMLRKLMNRNILGEISCKSSNRQHNTKIDDQYSRCKLATFLDWKGLPNVHTLFCLYTQNKFY